MNAVLHSLSPSQNMRDEAAAKVQAAIRSKLQSKPAPAPTHEAPSAKYEGHAGKVALVSTEDYISGLHLGLFAILVGMLAVLVATLMGGVPVRDSSLNHHSLVSWCDFTNYSSLHGLLNFKAKQDDRPYVMYLGEAADIYRKDWCRAACEAEEGCDAYTLFTGTSDKRFTGHCYGRTKATKRRQKNDRKTLVSNGINMQPLLGAHSASRGECSNSNP